MQSSQEIQFRRSTTVQSRLKVKNERSFLPMDDILREKVKSDFALGHFRGIMPKKSPQKEGPKTEIQLKRDQQFGMTAQQSKNKRMTFLKFGFRSHEKKNNYYLMPLIRKVRDAEGDVANDGSMGVVDLWSDRCINQLMEGMHMTKDNLIVRKMGRELNDSNSQIKQKLEERRMKERILMESMRMSSQEADTFALKYQLPQKNKKILDRIAQPTIISTLRNSISPNDKIQSIVGEIDTLHQDYLEIYTDLYDKIKNLQKHIK